MVTLFPSAAVLRQNYPLVSGLRTQGFAVGSFETGKPTPGDLFLISDGETPPVSSRTLVMGAGDPVAVPFRDGNPARLSFGEGEAALGAAFASAILRPNAPVAADPETLALFTLAERVAASDITVLINGPTGTGKEVLARAIHNGSPREQGPFIAINCAALPESMLEAMLFGHVKGSFTGASSGGQGFFRAAHGGTLLLDEIAEMPLGLQAKLLRALQEREVVPIGATEAEKVDVRVIACANRDLQAEVAAGRFRADLYYRLSVFPLSTKPLADRRGDIPALAAALIVRHAGARAQLPWVAPEAMALLMAYDWPGNVRELENVIQRALLLAPADAIDAASIVFDRPAAPVAPAPQAPSIDEFDDFDDSPRTLGKVVQMSEFAAIRETLAACGGSRAETARRLGISERTLRYRLAKARAEGEDISQVKSA